uniref:AAA+ ATPase domain-containing protein n=1 Tax=Cucumis sativus TaxID=3659 RepID=A0A0A0KM99_CUCSA
MAVPQSVSAVFSAYASFATTMMLIRSLTNELLPAKFISLLSSIYVYFFGSLSSQTKFVIDESSGLSPNEVFQAADIYLRTIISPSTDILKVHKTARQQNITLSIYKDQEITDYFQNIRLQWKLVCSADSHDKKEKRHFELLFPKKFKDRVVDFYLPYVLRKAKEIKGENKTVRICSQDISGGDEESPFAWWGSVNLDHPSTFDTLAMDPELKQWIIDDLDRFVRRRDFYRKVGKAWKRGYLLYGPPGTGKSSLIAAMANYLKFDIYDLDLSSIDSNRDLMRNLLPTKNRSILVIEDIDCSVQIQNREIDRGYGRPNGKFTLSGMLNFIDGLWSSVGDERIIIFTTNHKEKLDPALLRAGRMDVHIHMSYCSPKGLKVLASKYLGEEATEHGVYGEIEELIGADMEVSPSEIAEELMKGEQLEAVLGGLLNFLKRKREEKMKEKKREGDGKIEEVVKEEELKEGESVN